MVQQMQMDNRQVHLAIPAAILAALLLTWVTDGAKTWSPGMLLSETHSDADQDQP